MFGLASVRNVWLSFVKVCLGKARIKNKMKIEINFWIIFVVAFFVTVVLIKIPITLFPFGVMIGVLIIAVSFLLRKSLVYDTKSGKIERFK